MGFKKELTKLGARCVSLLAGVSAPGCTRRNPPPLIMTLLVRNEADIIRQNIEFHLGMGVSHIFATDNGSTDSTPAILAEYEDKGLLTLIHEPKQDFAQATWVNRMADMAYARFGRCLIFHCDADEFWYSHSGCLSDELLKYPLIDCLEVHVNNVLLLHSGFSESFPGDAILSVDHPLQSSNIQEDSRHASLYLYPYGDKVLYRARGHMPHVGMGNHVLLDRKCYVTRASGNITIYHFPVRGYQAFERKVVEGGSAIVSNTALAPGFGWQWRRWYQSYQEGRLKEEYRRLVLDKSQAEKYGSENVLKITPDLPRKLGLN